MRCIIILCLLLLKSSLIPAQHFHTNDLRQCFHAETNSAQYSFAKGNTNELQFVFSGLFLFYKFAISSQDFNKCSFYPSCSEFGLLAVKKHGAMVGMLATLDRLQRCNGLSPELYPYDREKNLLIDYP